MQACSGGELFDRIASHNCTEKDAAMGVVDALQALAFIHSKRIIHRDLKPENLLFKDKEPAAPLKLIDFGLALYLAPGERATEVCGTTSYMAPEVLEGDYHIECDLWSLGVIVYFMLSGSLPFPGHTDDEKEAKIMRGTYDMKSKNWSKVSAEGKDFVSKLLVSDPSKRLTGKKALAHPWITKRAAFDEKPLNEDVAKNLKKYADKNRFEKMLRQQMATNLTASELHRLRNIFEKLDTDGTGCIKTDDLKKALEDDATDSAAKAAFGKVDLTAFDVDGDGLVDWKEFVAGCIEDHDMYNDENLLHLFKSIDTDHSGTLTQKEVVRALGDSHELSREIMEALKETRGGAIDQEYNMTFEEFKNMLTGEKGDAGPAREATRGATRGRQRRAGAARASKPDPETRI